MKHETRDAKKLHEKRDFSYKRVNEYHKKFIDPKSGKFKSNLLEFRKCPVCNTEKYEIVLQKSGGTYVKCSKCAMIYLNPIFNELALKNYYINLNTGQSEIVSNENDFYKEIYLLGLKKIMKHKKKPGKILDIGCSSGFFLDIARELGWQTFGVELGEIEGRLCLQKGHILYKNLIKNLQIKERFDVITMWDVFEHIPNGLDELKLIVKLLKHDGLIFFQIPNSGSLAARVLKEKCRMFDGIEHVNLYNPKTFAMVANKSGCDIMHLSTVISEISVLNNYLDYSDPYKGKNAFNDNLLNILDSNFIQRNLLGYKIQAIFQRKK